MKFQSLILAFAVPLASLGGQTPIVDHHQHFFSPTLLAWAQATNPDARRLVPIAAKDLIAHLDSAGIKRAIVLSVAYQYGNPARVVENEYAKVKAENDWTAQQVAQYPDRLRAFCGVNPIRYYALEEIARCAKDPQLRAGLKLHFGNSDVNVHDPQQVEQLRRVFRAANDLKMPIVVHMRASVNNRRPHGAAEARIFLEELLPAAPDVPVQVAHLTGAGRYDDGVDSAAAVFAEAIAKHDPRTAHLYIDVSGVGGVAAMTPEQQNRIVSRIRQLGVDRIVFGSDAAVPGNSPREYWANFKTLPLTEAEFRAIATNVPYWR